jgi:tRNA-2-methylthio-N6-dimethylallyladenosine synthase
MDTMQLIRDVSYAAAFSFKYSPRPGTPGTGPNGLFAEPVGTGSGNQGATSFDS